MIGVRVRRKSQELIVKIQVILRIGPIDMEKKTSLSSTVHDSLNIPALV